MQQVLCVVVKNICWYFTRDVRKSTLKCTKDSKCYTAALIFAMFCTKWTSWENNCHWVPTLYVLSFSTYIISVFYRLSKSFLERRLEHSICGTLRQEQSTAEQFRLKPRTENQCALFYEYNSLLAMFRLNISLHFNSQTTPLV